MRKLAYSLGLVLSSQLWLACGAKDEPERKAHTNTLDSKEPQGPQPTVLEKSQNQPDDNDKSADATAKSQKSRQEQLLSLASALADAKTDAVSAGAVAGKIEELLNLVLKPGASLEDRIQAIRLALSKVASDEGLQESLKKDAEKWLGADKWAELEQLLTGAQERFKGELGKISKETNAGTSEQGNLKGIIDIILSVGDKVAESLGSSSLTPEVKLKIASIKQQIQALLVHLEEDGVQEKVEQLQQELQKLLATKKA